MRENNLNIQVYSSCNCNCEFCNFTDRCANKINPDFVLNYLKENPNINFILLTGGEPTFAIEECAKIIKALNLEEKKVVLQTNGWWGNNERVKQFIKDAPPSCVHLSVDVEKQKYIDINVVMEAYKFLVDLGIETFVVNHHKKENMQELNYYENLFPEVHSGKIVSLDDDRLHDCGVALLANNKIGRVNIKGWVETNG